MKIVYVAADGASFDSEKECLAHENFLAAKTDLIFKEVINYISGSSEIMLGEEPKKLMLSAVKSIRAAAAEEGVGSEVFADFAREVVRVLLIYAFLDKEISGKGELDRIFLGMDNEGYGGFQSLLLCRSDLYDITSLGAHLFNY